MEHVIPKNSNYILYDIKIGDIVKDLKSGNFGIVEEIIIVYNKKFHSYEFKLLRHGFLITKIKHIRNYK